MMAEIEGDFAVFLIGMKLSRPWQAAPLGAAGPRHGPDAAGACATAAKSGFLGAMPGLPVTVVYWRSYEQLEAWARSPGGSHWRAMAAFNRSLVETGGRRGLLARDLSGAARPV